MLQINIQEINQVHGGSGPCVQVLILNMLFMDPREVGYEWFPEQIDDASCKKVTCVSDCLPGALAKPEYGWYSCGYQYDNTPTKHC